MNKPIRTMSIAALLLFLALLGNATVLQYVNADELNEDDRNRRVIVASFSRERGAILVGRDPVAESVPSDDEYEFQRTYPAPFKYAHTTGFFSYYSQTGIERSMNDVLSGEDERLFVNRLVDLLSNAEPQGGNVTLTMRREAQDAAFEGLESLGEGVRGAVVALEPSTGKILAMASSPSFDPNRLADHDLGAVTDAYDELLEREDEPLLNRATQVTLPPGSTFKLVTAAALLEQDPSLDVDSLVPGGSSYQLPLTTGADNVLDNGGRSCGSNEVRLGQAIAQSCNTTFLRVADQLGAEALEEQAQAFGFDQAYLDDLPQAESIYPDDQDRPQTALAGIGQGSVTATPLQMAMVAAAIANDGAVMRPYVVDEVRSPDLDLLERTEPSEVSRAVSPATADVLTQAMVETVEAGTAPQAAIPGIPVAGKTGTAQSTPDRPPYAWFVSFAPADDPQVAVAVVVESSSFPREEIGGGVLGGPIARAVMEAVLR